MKKITQEELKDILDKHKMLLEGNLEGERADLSYTDLRGVDLSEAYLKGADLSYANLSGADLSEANLRGADLREVNFSCADLRGADLFGASLRRANLSEADLSEADLCRASLSGVNLSEAYLSGANLRGANLCRANLSEANFKGTCLKEADLYMADLSGAINMDIPMACPEHGEFIGWKKAYTGCFSHDRQMCLVKLLIPADAKRSSATGRKCRCNKAKVLDIEVLTPSVYKSMHAYSFYNPAFIYTLGEIVSVDNFDDDRFYECAPGIHFFMTKEEAANYGY